MLIRKSNALIIKLIGFGRAISIDKSKLQLKPNILQE
jgi:hypothetical protein